MSSAAGILNGCLTLIIASNLDENKYINLFESKKSTLFLLPVEEFKFVKIFD